MNLFNKKLLQQKIEGFKEFPEGIRLENTRKIITGWVKSLKDSDLSKTKEKSIEKSFLIRIFSDVLGYVDMGTSDDTFNLYPDYTIEGLYADGALGYFSKEKKQPLAVIELKDALTSLDKKQTGREKGYTPIEQAYQYSTKLDGCNWIIVSNFREIRIYNKSKSPDYYEKIDVLDLENDKEFKRFFYILSKTNLLADENQPSVIDNLLSQSTAQDKDITKAFYKEYKDIRLNFYNHFLEFNSEIEKIVLLEKTQKTLDRLIFVLFCEDTNGLLPLNISKLTYELGKKSRDRSDEKIWREFKNLFMDIDEGRFDIDPPINKYNGGLFKHDEILDNLHIKDSIWDELLRLSKYDFDSDINVNILGHIFEQSISDLESIKAEISGEVQEKSKSKRKKDGIFYTPEYITKYIVENSVGKYLEEHPEKLETIKILDPACGSGSMLNQAHSFLLQEYRNRFEQKMAEKESKKELRTLFDYNPAEVNRGILLNNLFGVDLNQESVEITKLSLWLKTASKVEPLQNLDKNIKCGNSLIDDPETAGDKAFDWNKEYEEIMNGGGFDVIIGNPPWGANFSDKEKQGIKKWSKFISGEQESYTLFIEKSFKQLRDGGYLCLITPNTWLYLEKFKELRKLIIDSYTILEIVQLEKGIFEDAPDIVPVIFVIRKNFSTSKIIPAYRLPKKTLITNLNNKDVFISSNISIDAIRSDNNLVFNLRLDDEVDRLLKKIELNPRIEETYKVRYGIKTGNNKKYLHNEYSNKFVKCLDSADTISKYALDWKGIYLEYSNSLAGYSTKSFEVPKILIQYIRKISLPDRIVASIDTTGEYYPLNNFSFIEGASLDDLYSLLGVLNSKLVNFYFTNRFIDYNIKPKYINKIPITSAVKDTDLIKLVKETLEYYSNRLNLIRSTITILNSEFPSLKLTQNVKTIEKLGWNDLNQLLIKKKVTIAIDKKEELQNWYLVRRKELQTIDNKLKSIIDLLDSTVYRLYGLNKEEINLIENMS